jgi:hypothetical protein
MIKRSKVGKKRQFGRSLLLGPMLYQESVSQLTQNVKPTAYLYSQKGGMAMQGCLNNNNKKPRIGYLLLPYYFNLF